jgi:hypothetical protein
MDRHSPAPTSVPADATTADRRKLRLVREVIHACAVRSGVKAGAKTNDNVLGHAAQPARP